MSTKKRLVILLVIIIAGVIGGTIVFLNQTTAKNDDVRTGAVIEECDVRDIYA